ncbi:MAG: NAD(P)-dependent glycerol-3-phosphate dehydrogenase [Erysipelotrichaceae bacterium]|nr:NAD(P)-dependent glycerol-3-phosphate dehydrogenase [Erysipelotrichaceae bacterium]
MKIGLLGSGSWSTALAQVLADNGQEVILKGRNPLEVADINENHRNERFFPGVDIAPQIRATLSYEDLLDSDILLMGVPVAQCRKVAAELVPLLDHPVIVINVAKGFDPSSKSRLSEVLKEEFGDKASAVVSLIGPSHAEEVILRLLTTVNAVSEDLRAAQKIQELFSNDYFRVYTNTDVRGAETAAALKNIYAIASGALTGLGQGDNARAALMTRGLHEMARYGLTFGGEMSTFLGMNGVGDLIVTCSSVHSRNYQAGLVIGRDDGAERFLKENTRTVEGILTTATVHELAKEKAISMPIADAVYAVLYEGKRPSDVIASLMTRPLKAENL